MAVRNSQHNQGGLEPFLHVSQAIDYITRNAQDHGPTFASANDRFPKLRYSANVPLNATITTRVTTPHPSGERDFTVREVACLQGSPLHHCFQGCKKAKFEQIGNAVPPPVAKAVLEEVRDSLLRTDGFIPDSKYFQAIPPGYMQQ